MQKTAVEQRHSDRVQQDHDAGVHHPALVKGRVAPQGVVLDEEAIAGVDPVAQVGEERVGRCVRQDEEQDQEHRVTIHRAPIAIGHGKRHGKALRPPGRGLVRGRVAAAKQGHRRLLRGCVWVIRSPLVEVVQNEQHDDRRSCRHEQDVIEVRIRVEQVVEDAVDAEGLEEVQLEDAEVLHEVDESPREIDALPHDTVDLEESEHDAELHVKPLHDFDGLQQDEHREEGQLHPGSIANVALDTNLPILVGLLPRVEAVLIQAHPELDFLAFLYEGEGARAAASSRRRLHFDCADFRDVGLGYGHEHLSVEVDRLGVVLVFRILNVKQNLVVRAQLVVALIGDLSDRSGPLHLNLPARDNNLKAMSRLHKVVARASRTTDVFQDGSLPVDELRAVRQGAPHHAGHADHDGSQQHQSHDEEDLQNLGARAFLACIVRVEEVSIEAGRAVR
eukprot:scaffold1330_cov240-Pinguiococcus_pyrenoidosus.AAC.24